MSRSIMKKLDNSLAQQINKLESSDGYGKLTESLYSQDENVQSLIKYTILVLIILIPLVIVLIFRSSNSSLLEDIETRQALVQTSSDIIATSSSLKGLEATYFANQYISTVQDFKSRISGALNMAGIDASSVTMDEGITADEVGRITIHEVKLNFNNMSNDDLFNFIRTLSNRLKVKIQEISVTKGEESKLLSGSMQVVYTGKSLESETPNE